MDNNDKRILELLSERADITATEISEKLHFSIPAVNKRIRAMKRDGIIKNFTVITDNKKVGKPILAFVLIMLKSVEESSLFFDYVNQDPDVLECYAVTGEYDCLIKIAAASVEDLDKKLMLLKTHSGVAKSYTMLSLTSRKYAPTVLADQ